MSKYKKGQRVYYQVNISQHCMPSYIHVKGTLLSNAIVRKNKVRYFVSASLEHGDYAKNLSPIFYEKALECGLGSNTICMYIKESHIDKEV